MQRKKARFIPLFCQGKISERECARKIGCSLVTVWVLKKKYLAKGAAAFVNGHKGMKPKNKRFTPELCAKICTIYKTDWPDVNFNTFQEQLKMFYHIKVSYNTLRLILRAGGIKPPRSWTAKEKQEHKSRKEREKEGELVQMDASEHDWFMNGQMEVLHGGIDDATHKITGLYFCQNECRLGYNEVLRQTWQAHGVPRSYYIDRHSSFVKSARKKHKTLQERIEYAKNERTHFTDLCERLDIEVILALSAQAKGRIERLWQTLQGKLPFIFRYLKISTIDAANNFVRGWVVGFNKKYAVLAAKSQKAWGALPAGFDFDYELSVKFSCQTDFCGRFTFHGCEFSLAAPSRAYKKFELCLSETFGLRGYVGGAWYAVRLEEPYLMDTVGDTMPAVEKDLIARYLNNNLHTSCA